MKISIFARNFSFFVILFLIVGFCIKTETTDKLTTCCVTGSATTQGGPAVGCTVTISQGFTVICSTTTQSNGSYQCCGNFSYGTYTLTIYCNSSCHTSGNFTLDCDSNIYNIDVPCE